MVTIKRKWTVEDLIKELEKYPKHLHVYSWGSAIEGIKVLKEYPLGDSNNPYCQYEDVLMIE